MFLKKRKYTYQDFLNNNIQTKKPMNKPETLPKIQTLLNNINPPVDKIDKPISDKPIIDKPITDKPIINKPNINNSFINKIIDKIIDKPNDTVKQFNIPNTSEEWSNFHKITEDNMKIAYNKKEGVYIKNGMMYIAGTRGFNDVMDWVKIPLGIFDKSDIYKNAEKIYNENKDKVKVVIGHSAGGSAALQLHQTYPNDVIPITYNAPVFAISNGLSDVDKSLKPLRFVTRFDPVSAFDYQARVTDRKFDINNDFIENAYKDAARQACPNVQVITLDGRSASARETAWAGADVFCSLSDNIQETFGIVPIEAMAAGLPVVVSDWDGYKDTVRHGVDGFRIPTCMPQAGLATDLALRHALEVDTYDMYCGHTCSLVSVDIEATAQAFVQLFESAELRQQMGQAGKQRAKQLYDWRAIIAQYEALWQEQTQLRLAAQTAKQGAALQHAWPARIDPFFAFESYPTQTLKPTSMLALTDLSVPDAQQRLNQYKTLAMVNFAKLVLPTDEEVASVFKAAAHGPVCAQAMLETITPSRQAFVLRSLVWLLKLGLLRLA